MFNSSINTVHSSSLTGSLYLKTSMVLPKKTFQSLTTVFAVRFLTVEKMMLKKKPKED